MDSKAYIGVKRMGEVDINPFLTVAKRKYEGENEIIDEEDMKLKSLKGELGDEVYEAVTTALTEMNEYNGLVVVMHRHDRVFSYSPNLS
ncbi:hypothetical protein U1Q18_026288 [Sarracenia purpurea var. burkii]